MIAAFSLSAIGPKRERNEDCILVDPARRLFVVADGLGGHGFGDEASRLAVASATKIHAIASAAQGADGICRELVRCARTGGGTDALSVVLVMQEVGDSQHGEAGPRAAE